MMAEDHRHIMISAPVLGENWANISDPIERRRAQNRVAQRGYRKRLREEGGNTKGGQNGGRAKVAAKQAEAPSPTSDTKLLQTSTEQHTVEVNSSRTSPPHLPRRRTEPPYPQGYPQRYPKQQEPTPPLLPSDIQTYTSTLDNVGLSNRNCSRSPEGESHQGFFDLEASISEPIYSNPHLIEPGPFNPPTDGNILGSSSAPSMPMSRLTPPGSASPPRGVDAHGHTALHRAALHGHESVLAVLLQAGADPALPDSTGLTPLHLATQRGHIGGVQLLLSSTPRPWDIIRQVTHTGETALHLAVQSKQPAVARLLLDHSTRDVNCQDWLGRTALHMACESNQHELVEVLVQAGAQLDIRDFEGQTLLHSACMAGSL